MHWLVIVITIVGGICVAVQNEPTDPSNRCISMYPVVGSIPRKPRMA